MNRLPRTLRSFALAAGLAAAMGLWPSACASTTTPTAEAAPGAAAGPSFGASPGLTQAMGNSIADVTERALPSVVSVLATKITPARGQSQFPFPFPFGPSPEQPPGEAHGLGSGVVVSADGVILTNNHVVEGAQDVRIVTNDDKEYTAKVVGTDPKSDLAVVRLTDPGVKLPPITVGDSSKLRLGEVVLAIGNPFGVGQTVTMGIVSAKGRADVGITAYEDFIQTGRSDQPRQLRRRADQHARRARGHQHGDPVAQRRQHGYRLRHPDRDGDAHHAEPAQVGSRQSRLPRCLDPGRDARSRARAQAFAGARRLDLRRPARRPPLHEAG